jgi:hypothetical protein
MVEAWVVASAGTGEGWGPRGMVTGGGQHRWWLVEGCMGVTGCTVGSAVVRQGWGLGWSSGSGRLQRARLPIAMGRGR